MKPLLVLPERILMPMPIYADIWSNLAGKSGKSLHTWSGWDRAGTSPQPNPQAKPGFSEAISGQQAFSWCDRERSGARAGSEPLLGIPEERKPYGILGVLLHFFQGSESF